METPEIKPLSEASSKEEFSRLREEARTATAEPAVEKTPQTEEVTPVSASEPGTGEQSLQENTDTPVEKSADEQIRELRAKGKHAAANKLMVEAATKVANERAEKAERDLEALRSRPVEQPKPEAKPAAVQPQQAADSNDTEPKLTDEKYSGADGYQQYIRDAAIHAFRQEAKRTEQERVAQDHQARASKVLEEGKKGKPDFDAVVGRVVVDRTVIREGVDKIPNFGEVLYKLGSDPAELSRIQALSPFDQFAEIKMISRDLAKPVSAVLDPPVALKPAVTRVAAAPRVLSGHDDPPPPTTRDAAEKGYESFRDAHGTSRYAARNRRAS